MSFFISDALAQTTGAAPAPAWMSNFPIIMIAVMVGMMYFMVIRPQNKRQAEHQKLLGQLGKGDEIITSSGIAGKIDEMGDPLVSLEVAVGVKIKVQKNAISQVLPKGTLRLS
jgi:preprotein translocase subunit YajC